MLHKINILKSISDIASFLQTIYSPILEYGSELFNTAAKAYLNRLDSIQYIALKVITGAMKATSLQTLTNTVSHYIYLTV